MNVTTDRVDDFAIAPDALWSRIGQLDRYTTWWPWLERFEANGLVEGDSWRCVVRSPINVRVRFTVTIGAVDPGSYVTATVDGDIAGSARLDIELAEDGCRTRLRSELAPQRRPLRWAAIVASPILRRGHDRVLDDAVAQFTERAAAG
jgi:hypothetical protein